MKVYILKDVYVSPSSIHIKTDIRVVFSSLKLLLEYLENKKEKWEPNYKEGIFIFKNYYDLETYFTSDNSNELYYLLYRNNLGYFNNPEPFRNKSEAEKMLMDNTKQGKDCQLKKIEIDLIPESE